MAYTSTAQEVRIGTQNGRKLEEGTDAEPWSAAYWLAPHALLSLSIGPRSVSPGMASPTMGWAFPHQSLIRKISYSWLLGRHFLN